MKYIVIGGVAAGAAFATRLRRLDEEAKIIIYEKTNFVSYANCGLPYYVGDVIKDKASLTLQTPESLKKRFNIDVFINHEVIDLDKENKSIKVKNLKTNEEFNDNYDKLILCLGSKAIEITPKKDNIFVLKTVEDSNSLKRYLDENINEVKTAVVIGGGFIGIEILENLKERGIEVLLIEGQAQVLTNFDYEMISFIHNELKRNNVKLFLNKMVKNIKSDNKKASIYLDDETVISTDIVIEAIGVRPNTSFLEGKLPLEKGALISNNEDFSVYKDEIYALGDDTLVKSEIDNEYSYIALANIAAKEGRDLASYLVNKEKHPFKIRALGTSIVKVFNLNCASTGFNEKTLKRKNMPYSKIYLSPFNHASYYPGSDTLNIKVLFDPTSYLILGAQIIGKEGVDKRIDLLAMAIKHKIRGNELKDLDLSYAPPFGSSKDPINMIGYMIENLKNKYVNQFYLSDLNKLINDSNSSFVDVRTKEEFDISHIKGSINIPIDELRDRLDELDKSKNIYLICESALRSYLASRILLNNNINSSHLAGGFRLYREFNEAELDIDKL